MEILVKIRKYISLLAFLIPLVLVGQVHAADIDIVCNDEDETNTCEIKSLSHKLFDVSNWAPGQTISRSLQVRNEDSNEDCDLKMFTDNAVASPSEFPQIMFTAIKGNADLLFGDIDVGGDATSTKNLQDIFDSSYINFGEVTKNGGTVIYDWIVTFDKDAGNYYQSSNVSYDFSINFVCGTESTDDDEGGGTVAGIAAPVIAFFGGWTAPETVEGDVEGVTTETGGETQGESIAGFQTCRDSLLIWLLFVLQFIALLIINKKIVGIKKKFLYILLSMVVLPLGFYLFLCNKWYTLISLAISLFWMIL